MKKLAIKILRIYDKALNPEMEIDNVAKLLEKELNQEQPVIEIADKMARALELLQNWQRLNMPIDVADIEEFDDALNILKELSNQSNFTDISELKERYIETDKAFAELSSAHAQLIKGNLELRQWLENRLKDFPDTDQFSQGVEQMGVEVLDQLDKLGGAK